MDPTRKARHQGTFTSCDESEDQLVQRYDDDKLELTCFQNWFNTAFFIQSRFGQVRSPFVVELKDKAVDEAAQFKEDKEERKEETEEGSGEDDYLALAVDGEIYKIKNGKRLSILLDPVLPKVRMLRRIKQEKDMNGIMEELLQYGLPFV